MNHILPSSVSMLTYLVQDHFVDEGQAFRLVHAGTDELAAQQELPVVLLLVLGVDRLPLLCKGEPRASKLAATHTRGLHRLVD